MGDRETNQTMQTSSSSSRRETRSENRHGLKRSIGCMAGIFHLLSRRHHHNRSRKRLPSARKKDETITSLPSPDKRPPPPPQEEISGGKKREPNRAANTEKAVVVQEFRRHSCEVPRSPTLPPEIRRSSSAGSPDSPRRPPALVARLMGLEDVPVSSPESSAAEKRRKLLGALEKCDEDLKALKRLIEAVRLAEIRVKALATVGSVERIEVGGVKCPAGRHDLDGGDSRMEKARSAEINGEQPSPISVLDAIWSPRCRSRRQDNG